ncbi:D-alanyl-D-alanine carboxypeptidase/D-alanyl-D-alanine endopeptidase [Neobacillus sp. SM06]|uniref:D-alanyl-D-alanine carboxypeptidase/D-alanyl-D-alanine endopeptidase n=1 Tax=Neobacillus sp. SM06 TaxID=3422492 RepID=UPI003D2DD994
MMQIVKKSVTVILVFLLLTSSAVEAAGNREQWSDDIDRLLNEDPNLNGSIAGVSIRSAKTGEIQYEHFANLRLRPASNLKLLTAAAALSVLGENYTFSTEILAKGKLKKGILQGNLYLKGKGDPTLLPNDFDQVAFQLKNIGIKKIQGDVIGDDTWYDRVRYSVDLPWSDEQTYYGAPISALTLSPTNDYDTATVLLEVKPGRQLGKKAHVEFTPKTHPLKIVNQTKTVQVKEETKLTFERDHITNTVTINGTISQNEKSVKGWMAVTNPTVYTTEVFKQSLLDNGIKVKRKAMTGKTPQSANLLVSRKSMPLSKLLVPFMKLSNNGHAEILVKEMGKKVYGTGSWEKGLQVMHTKLRQFGIHSDQIVIRDGSGVSHMNLITANQLSQFLFAVQKEPWFPVFYQSMPQAGSPEKMIGGTLRKRLKDKELTGKVRAKTGSITSVSSLSGYVQTKNSGTVVFSILLNNLLDESKGKAIEDRIVRILANS